MVYIEKSIALTEANFEDLGPVHKLEAKVGGQLLNSELEFSTGSGFFFDGQGDLVTNAHVAAAKDESSARSECGTGWGRYIDENFPDKEMPQETRRTLKVALFKAITTGQVHTRVLVKNRNWYNAEVKFADTGLDLAILSVPLDGSVALALGEDRPAVVGTDVFSIGYPFGSDAVKDKRNLGAAFTTGIVSALREQGWIQHTATLNPGNSGGPLLDSQGRVLGVNSRLRTNANNTYFAIPVAKVRQYITGHGFPLAAPAPVTASGPPAGPDQMLHQDALGEWEVSADLVFNQETGSVVKIDGVQVGVTPLFYNPTVPVFDVSVEGTTGRFEGKLRVMKSLSGSTDVKVPWDQYTASVKFTAGDPDTLVYLDGKPLGKSPVTETIPVGSHILSAQSAKMIFEPQTIQVAKVGTLEYTLTGTPVFDLTFQGSPDRPVLEATQGDSHQTFSPGDPVRLGAGRWHLTWPATNDLNEGALDVEVTNLPVTVDARPFLAHGTLVLKGLDPGASVLIDGKSLGKGLNSEVVVLVGTHKVQVVQRGWTPFAQSPVEVTKDSVVKVDIQRSPSGGAYGNLTICSGVGVALAGTALTVFGLYEYGDQVALDHTSAYSDYTDWKSRAKIEYYSGLAAAGMGLAGIVLGFYLDALLDKDENPDQE